jgi:hypothetical protein
MKLGLLYQGKNGLTDFENCLLMRALATKGKEMALGRIKLHNEHVHNL